MRHALKNLIVADRKNVVFNNTKYGDQKIL